MSDLLTAHVKIDVDKMKTELDLHKKYIICEQLGRYVLYLPLNAENMTLTRKLDSMR